MHARCLYIYIHTCTTYYMHILYRFKCCTCALREKKESWVAFYLRVYIINIAYTYKYRRRYVFVRPTGPRAQTIVKSAIKPSEKWLWQCLPQSAPVCKLSGCSATVCGCLKIHLRTRPCLRSCPSDLENGATVLIASRFYNLSYTTILPQIPSAIIAARIPEYRFGALSLPCVDPQY